MKKIIIFCLTINIFIYSLFAYFLFFRNSNNELIYMIDVTNVIYDKNFNLLDDYKVEIIEIESILEKNKIVYTEPKFNEVTQKNQIIKLYISKGYVTEYYDNLVNKNYEENLEYIEKLENEYNINIIIENQISNDYADGIIIFQSLYDEIISNQTLKLIVNYNEPLILIPDFTNQTINYVINYFKDTNITINFIYENNKNNVVFKQSIEANSLVLNNSIIYIYVS